MQAKSPKELSSSARALMSAVDAHAGLNHAAPVSRIRLDTPKLIASINSVLDLPPSPREKSAFHALNLLLSLARHYPRQVVVEWDAFLPTAAGVPPLFALLLREGVDDKDKDLAVQCLVVLLRGMPLAAWLNSR